MYTSNSIPILVKDQLEYIQKYKIGISTKETDYEHTKRIGILLGVNIQYASTSWHKCNIKHLYQIALGLIKVKNDVIYERNYKSKYMVIYAVESNTEKVIKSLTKMSFRNNFYTKYISFKNTNSQIRIGYLHTNNCYNVNGKFEILFDSDINKLI